MTMSSDKAGYPYTIARLGHCNSVSVGYTCAPDPEPALKNQYVSRLSPMDSLCIHPTFKAVVAEAIFKHVLQESWVSNKLFLFINRDQAIEDESCADMFLRSSLNPKVQCPNGGGN